MIHGQQECFGIPNRSAERLYLLYTDNAGASITASVTNISYTVKVVDTENCFNGTVFTAPKTGWYYINGGMEMTTSVTLLLFLYVNGIKKYWIGGSTALSAGRHKFDSQIPLNQGDQLSLRSDQNCTLSDNANNHWIAISG